MQKLKSLMKQLVAFVVMVFAVNAHAQECPSQPIKLPSNLEARVCLAGVSGNGLWTVYANHQQRSRAHSNPACRSRSSCSLMPEISTRLRRSAEFRDAHILLKEGLEPVWGSIRATQGLLHLYSPIRKSIRALRLPLLTHLMALQLLVAL